MHLDNTFHVPVDVDRAWTVLTDLERIAPCMPGARLESVVGDEFQGTVRVKVGPIVMQYRGLARIVEKDRQARRLVVAARGRDVTGTSSAEATVTVHMRPDGDLTLVQVATDLNLTGKVAQLGRGAITDISARLIDEFLTRLRKSILDEGQRHDAPAPGAPPESRLSDDTLDMLSLAGPRVLLPPVVLAAAATLFVWSLARLVRTLRTPGAGHP
jgi:carbon monoxide dehydrogenase subunit G